jgi:hypothetical protein
MQAGTRTRWAGLLLAVGTILFSLATILGEPFEQDTVSSLLGTIASNSALYTTVNLLATVGFVVIIVGFALLTLLAQGGRMARPRLQVTGLGLLVAAAAFWLVEVVARFGLAASGTSSPVTGGNETGLLATPLGTGLNAVFLAFLVLALAGLAALVWGLGDNQVLPRRLAHLGSGLVIVSGILAVLFYPWVGEVERALFYPLVLVVLPAAVYLLLRRQRTTPPVLAQ